MILESGHALGIQARRSAGRGFTLIELLAVIALISLIAGVIGFSIRNQGRDTVGLQTAQSILVSAFTLARAEAILNGEESALMVSDDATDSEKYLRFIVPVLWNETTRTWTAITEGYYLPSGSYVVPYRPLVPAEFEVGEDWAATPAPRSTWLQKSGSIALKGLSDTATPWIWMEFSERGSSNSGDLVIATGRINPPSAAKPFIFTNPDNVRGMAVSYYGQFTLLNNRKEL